MRFQYWSLQVHAKGGDSSIDDTADQKELAKIASERWGRYQNTFVPAENRLIDESLNYNKESRLGAVKGGANAAVQGASNDAINRDSAILLEAAGINPQSGSFDAVLTENQVDTGKAITDNVNRSVTAVDDSRTNRMKNVIAMGNGQASEAVSGMQNIAQNSAVEAANNAFTKAQNRSNNLAGAGAITGMGVRGAVEYNKGKSA